MDVSYAGMVILAFVVITIGVGLAPAVAQQVAVAQGTSGMDSASQAMLGIVLIMYAILVMGSAFLPMYVILVMTGIA